MLGSFGGCVKHLFRDVAVVFRVMQSITVSVVEEESCANVLSYFRHEISGVVCEQVQDGCP